MNNEISPIEEDFNAALSRYKAGQDLIPIVQDFRKIIEQISNLLKGQIGKKALRVGVRSGGCSGMSYTMDFIGTDDINPDDKVYDYSLKADQSFQVVCDPKSLLYIYGMQLDFSKELIGGGFNFVNPNASQTCGCGSSFAVW